MSDQHNAKCTGWGSFPTPVHTPNLDRLAASGVRFDQAFTQNPLCTPARASFLTGQYPINHGHYGLTGYGATDSPATHPPTVFSMAAQAGYRMGIFGKVHTPPGLIESEVDVIRDVYGHNAEDHYEAYLEANGVLADRDDDQLPEWREQAGPGAGQGIDARPTRLAYEHTPEYWATRQAMEFIQESDEPCFVWLSFPRPHQVHTPPERFWDLYPAPEDLSLPPSADEDLTEKPPHQKRTRTQEQEMEFAVFEPRTYDALRRRKLKGYLGCVSMVDDLVGQLLNFLDNEGCRGNTLVVYCSDHGDFATEHGFLEKAPGISYDAISRVPFVWSWPERFEGSVARSELVAAVDFFPTIAGLLDAGPVESADGKDLSAFLDGSRTEPVRSYAVTENPWSKSVRTETHRLTVYPRGFFGDESKERFELYDLDADPWEMENLAKDSEYAGTIQELSRYLYEFTVRNRRPTSTHPALASGDEPQFTDGTVPPERIAQHLAAEHGSNYL